MAKKPWPKNLFYNIIMFSDGGILTANYFAEFRIRGYARSVAEKTQGARRKTQDARRKAKGERRMVKDTRQ